MKVLGIDIAHAAVEAARAKATKRGVNATFEVGDVLALDRLWCCFATAIDSGVFLARVRIALTSQTVP